jgi:hypothetical protein
MSGSVPSLPPGKRQKGRGVKNEESGKSKGYDFHLSFLFYFLDCSLSCPTEGFESSFSFFSLGYVQGLITILPIDIDK